MTSNTEFLLERMRTDILGYRIKNLDDCVKFDGEDTCDYIFYNTKLDIVYQVTFKYDNLQVHNYNFFSHTFSVMSTKVSNKFLCVDWTPGELTVLKYKMEQFGISNYTIAGIYLDPHHEVETIHALIFKEDSDAAAFQMYFQKLFNNTPESDTMKVITEKKFLE